MRHGQTAWNLDQRAQGHRDLPLDETGKAQAQAVRHSFSDFKVQRIITSDLERAYETALPIADAKGLIPEVDPRIRERNFGEWEGSGFAEIAARFEVHSAIHGIQDRSQVRPPKGESMQDVWNRLAPFTQELLEKGEDTIVVSHGGTLSTLLAMLIGGDLGVSSAFKFFNTGVTQLDQFRGGQFRLVKYNDISHLNGIEAIAGTVDGSSR